MTLVRTPILLTQPLFHVDPGSPHTDRLSFYKLWECNDKAALMKSIAENCRGAIVRGTFSAEDMDLLPGLGIIAVCGVGYDGVDVKAAIKRGIQVTNTPDVLTEDVADLALGLLLACGRKIVQADKYVRQGKWETEGEMTYNPRVHGKRLGIIGLGRIGMAIARRCLALNMDIGYHNRNQRNDVNFHYFRSALSLAAWSDYLILATPGGKETRHIVNREVLSALGPNGMLVNVGRGTNVDQSALAEALNTGIIACAALDVLEGEPLVPQELMTREDNLILQPHHASATFETRQAMVDLALDNIQAHLDGRKLLTPIVECQ
jgi:lactate dehydrogenase-like 2-hydroxyacid dehydrogenase